ncbi:MAG: hypothetical protein AAB445_00985 [Patescibacteria group bacterium]
MRKSIASALITLGTLGLPLVAFADSDPQLTNPLGINDPKLLIVRVLRYALGLLGVVSLIMIIYGGFLMLTSGGNADTLKKAKGTIVWAAAGMAVILGSWQILRFIFDTVNEVAK